MLATLTSKGQITIPHAIRRQLGLKAGHRLDFRLLEDGRVELRVVDTVTIDDLKRLLPRARRRLSLDEMDEIIGEAACERQRDDGR